MMKGIDWPQGLRDTYEMFKEHLWETIRSGAVPRHASQAGAARTVSSAAKEAAEDLINNGIFISWGQLTTAFLLIFCAFMVARCGSSVLCLLPVLQSVFSTMSRLNWYIRIEGIMKL
jgi:hypothetical protein